MELGADEYIVKPFPIQVLLAKVNALVRRLYGDYASPQSKDEIQMQGIVLNQTGFKLSYQNQTQELSKNEYKLMRMFLQNPDKVLSREILLEELWDESSFVDDNTLTVNVTRVKNKLSSLLLEDMIKTKRGAGYLFDTTKLKEK